MGSLQGETPAILRRLR